jgi:type I restriction enzyme M protein
MTYWNETMQDDCYIISADGWKAETYRITVENKTKKNIDKGWTCDLVPKGLVINRYFSVESQGIATLEAEKESIIVELTEMEEEHSGEEGYFAELEKVNKANIQKRLRDIKGETDSAEETKILQSYLDLLNKQSVINKKIKDAEKDLDNRIYTKYSVKTHSRASLIEEEIKTLVVDDKWMQSIEKAVKNEIDHISQRLTNRIKELAERYETPLPVIDKEVQALERKVNAHLKKMGFSF